MRALPAREPFRLEIIADAHVHAVNADASPIAVQVLDVFKRCDEAAGEALTLVVQDFQTQDFAFGRHAGHLFDVLDRLGRRNAALIALANGCNDAVSIARLEFPGDDSSHVGPMAGLVGTGLFRPLSSVSRPVPVKSRCRSGASISRFLCKSK